LWSVLQNANQLRRTDDRAVLNDHRVHQVRPASERDGTLKRAVSTTIDLPSFVTFTRTRGFGGTYRQRHCPANPAGTTVAKPLHLSDPSGQ
jgi:hypothetical protein